MHHVASGKAAIKDSYHWPLWSCPWTKHCCTHYWAEQSLPMATENREKERHREEENTYIKPFKPFNIHDRGDCVGSHKVWDFKPLKRHRGGCHPQLDSDYRAPICILAGKHSGWTEAACGVHDVLATCLTRRRRRRRRKRMKEEEKNRREERKEERRGEELGVNGWGPDVAPGSLPGTATQ